jgi:hypothetical protein
MKLSYRTLLATVVATSLAVPAAAMADRRHGDRDYDGHHNDRHYSYRKYDRHYDRNYYRGYGDRHVTRVYKDHDDDDLLIGLLVGGVLGYAINNAQHSNSGTYSYPAPRAYDNAYVQPDSYGSTADSCLQEREYTTTVRVGGRNVEAYGTACLQPDGSWSRGPAQTVSY